jgi:hypothetical protein
MRCPTDSFSTATPDTRPPAPLGISEGPCGKLSPLSCPMQQAPSPGGSNRGTHTASLLLRLLPA